MRSLVFWIGVAVVVFSLLVAQLCRASLPWINLERDPIGRVDIWSDGDQVQVMFRVLIIGKTIVSNEPKYVSTRSYYYEGPATGWETGVAYAQGGEGVPDATPIVSGEFQEDIGWWASNWKGVLTGGGAVSIFAILGLFLAESNDGDRSTTVGGDVFQGSQDISKGNETDNSGENR